MDQSLYKTVLRALPDDASGSTPDEPCWLDVGEASLRSWLLGHEVTGAGEDDTPPDVPVKTNSRPFHTHPSLPCFAEGTRTITAGGHNSTGSRHIEQRQYNSV